MTINTPIIDNRDKERILAEVIARARYFVPEWNTDASAIPDAGMIFASVFSQMTVDTLQRLNKMPYNHFLFFLNLLGTQVNPGAAAKGFVTVVPTPDSPGVYVRRGTKLYGNADDTASQPGRRVLYETDGDMFALDNRLGVVLCTSGNHNKVVMPFIHKNETNENNEVSAFVPYYLFDFKGYDNIQRHELAFSHPDVLNTGKNASIEIQFINTENPHTESVIAKRLANMEKISWILPSEDPENNPEIILKRVSAAGNTVRIESEYPIQNGVHGGEEGRWLVCKALDHDSVSEIQFTDIRIKSKNSGIIPDIVANNDLELSKRDFMPFGERFSLYDDFYIACEEAFTKKGAAVTLNFDMSFERIESEIPDVTQDVNWKHILPAKTFETPDYVDIRIERVSWEYWNGNGWARLFIDDQYDSIFFSGTISESEVTGASREEKRFSLSFVCPEGFEQTYMGAHQGYWIRARVLKIANAFKIYANYVAPVIRSVRLSYEYEHEAPRLKQLLFPEDLEYNIVNDFGKAEQFIYFRKNMAEPVTYFGFDRPIRSGPIKIFFQISRGGKTGPGEVSAPPALRFEYLSRKKWHKLNMLDETEYFTRSGIVTFVLNEEPELRTLFGQEKYWLRVVNTDSRYDTGAAEAAGVSETAGAARAWREMLPCIHAVHFNTVRVTQRETPDEEFFLAEPNTRGAQFFLQESNPVDIDVWVDEILQLTDTERAALKKEGVAVREEKDAEGFLKAVWVRWTPVRDLLMSEPNDRHYTPDVISGSITFGNGKSGRLPAGQNGSAAIRVRYGISDGADGNTAVNAVNGFAESVPFISRVYNPEPILGGCDRETISEAASRGALLLHNRNKAVSARDMEHLSREADRNIVRIKCFAHRDTDGRHAPGQTTLTVLPRTVNTHTDYFAGIKRNIANYLETRAPATLLPGLNIIEATYVEICVGIEVTVDSYDDYQWAYREIDERVTSFLNPLYGNFNSGGFDIGQMPAKEHIYNYVKTMERIREINAVNIEAYINKRGRRIEIDYTRIGEYIFAVPVPGAHDIHVVVR